jgi:hypothetical protein
LWRSVLDGYELSPAELEVLAQAARVTDLLARLDEQLAGEDLIQPGSRGQPVPNPLLHTAAEQRRVLESLIRSLALPMPDETEGRRRSPAAREAAQQRWRQQKSARGRG